MMEWITGIFYVIGHTKDLVLGYYPGYRPLEKYDAYTMEPTEAYYIMIAISIFVSAFLCDWTGLRCCSISNGIDKNVIRSMIVWYLSVIWLTSKEDTDGIFQITSIIPHITIGSIIGFVVKDLKDFYVEKNANLCFSEKMFYISTQLFKGLLNIFILINPIIVNIYLHYIQLLEFSRICRVCIKSVEVFFRNRFSKQFVHIACIMMLSAEFYSSLYILFWRFKSILPPQELNTLKSVNLCIFILSLINLWEDTVQYDLKTYPINH